MEEITTDEGTTANNMFALWPGDQLNFSIFIKPTFGFVGQRAASKAGHIANTNVRRKGPGQFFQHMKEIFLTILLTGYLTIVFGQKLDNSFYLNIDKIGTVDGLTRYKDMSRPKIGLHELTCKHHEKIDKNYSRTGSHHC
jgi:hypothetical protein